MSEQPWKSAFYFLILQIAYLVALEVQAVGMNTEHLLMDFKVSHMYHFENPILTRKSLLTFMIFYCHMIISPVLKIQDVSLKAKQHKMGLHFLRHIGHLH